MNQIKIETGLKEFRLNDSVSIFFNPADASFAEKIYKAFGDLDREAEKYQERAKTAKNEEIWLIGKEMDANMRERLFGLFNVDIVTPLIGDMNVYALADGMPVWANILFAIIDEMDTAAKEQAKLRETKMAHYTAKYRKVNR